MFCLKCGMMIDDDSRFCNGCGAEVINKKSLSQKYKYEKYKNSNSEKVVKGIFITFIMCLLIMVISSIGYLGLREIRAKYFFVCNACQEETIGKQYHSKRYKSVICEDCIQMYYPDSWQKYFEIR